MVVFAVSGFSVVEIQEVLNKMLEDSTGVQHRLDTRSFLVQKRYACFQFFFAKTRYFKVSYDQLICRFLVADLQFRKKKLKNSKKYQKKILRRFHLLQAVHNFYFYSDFTEFSA